MEAEVLVAVEQLRISRVVAGNRAALDRVVALRGVKAEHGGRAIARHRAPANGHAEGVRRVVEHGQIMPLGDCFDGVHIAGVAVDVNGQDRARLRRDLRFQQCGIEREVIRFHVAKHGRKTAAHDCVRGGDKRKRSRDDFARFEVERGDGAFQREVSVGKEAKIRRSELLRERGLQLLMLRAAVGEVAGGEDLAHEGFIFFHRRQRRARYQNRRIFLLHKRDSFFAASGNKIR